MADVKIQFRPSVLDGALEARTAAEISGPALTMTAVRDLHRYYEALALALSSVSLTSDEAMLLIDATNGSMFEPMIVAAQTFHYDIQDALGEGLGAKWGVDGVALVNKIVGWSLIQRIAVMDAIERYWGNAHHIEDSRKRLVQVGLVKA